MAEQTAACGHDIPVSRVTARELPRHGHGIPCIIRTMRSKQGHRRDLVRIHRLRTGDTVLAPTCLFIAHDEAWIAQLRTAQAIGTEVHVAFGVERSHHNPVTIRKAMPRDVS